MYALRLKQCTLFARMILLPITLFLISCTSENPLQRASIVSPKQTRNGIPFMQNSCDRCHKAWWKNLHDPVLNQLISEALVHNNQIKAARATIIQAQAQLRAAHFSWLPTVDATANAFVGGTFDNHLTPRGALAQSPAISQLSNMQFNGYLNGFVPRYSLNLLKNYHNDRGARASLNIQKANFLAVRLSIVSQVSGGYFMLLGQKQQLELQYKLIQDLIKLRDMERIRYHDGASDYTAVSQLDQKIEKNRANILLLQNSLSQIENALQILLDKNPGAITTKRHLHQLSVNGLIPDHLPATVLTYRPDVVVAENQLKLSLANLGIAYAQFFPTFSLTTLMGAASLDLRQLLALKTGLWLAAPMMSIPIFNMVAYAQIKANKAGVRAAYFNYVQTLRIVFADVDNNLVNQQNVNASYMRQVAALNAAKKTYQLAIAKYEAGATDLRTVLNATLSVDDARWAVNEAKMQQLDSIVAVYQSLAGGCVP
jgi:multidrug efflux system outer membrane protein